MRYLLVSIVAHVLVVSFVWVVFSVPTGRDQNSFTYLGELITTVQEPQNTSVANGQAKESKEVVFEDSPSAFFTPWLKMRQVDKPR